MQGCEVEGLVGYGPWWFKSTRAHWKSPAQRGFSRYGRVSMLQRYVGWNPFITAPLMVDMQCIRRYSDLHMAHNSRTHRTPIPVLRAQRSLGGSIATWRKLRGLTQAQLAERADVSRGVIGRIEAADGGVSVGAGFRALEAAWMDGIAAMARAGARIIIDDAFLGGAASQQRWQKTLAGLAVLWVGVRCDSAVAAGREIARGDRTQGMATSQANVVHEGVSYDLEVDTTQTESLACARTIAARVT